MGGGCSAGESQVQGPRALPVPESLVTLVPEFLVVLVPESWEALVPGVQGFAVFPGFLDEEFQATLGNLREATLLARSFYNTGLALN